MKTKRILSLLLSLIMMLSTLSAAVFAENEEPSDVVGFTAQAYGSFLCAPQADPCALSPLGAESSDSNSEELELTPEFSSDIDAKLQTNTAPAPVETQSSESITIGDKYTVSLDDIFTDADEADELTYKVAIDDAEATAADADYSFTPDEVGEYKLTFTANDGTADSEAYIVTLTVTAKLLVPESITIEHDVKNVLTDGVIVVQKGDKFNLTARDQNGEVTPVKWKNTSSWDTTFVVDETTGEVEVMQDVYSSTSYIYFEATSTLDETVSEKITIKATGIAMSDYNKAQTVDLSADGQTAKTASVTGGIKGYNIWSYNIPEGVAELAADPGTGNSVKFNVYRPGTISATFKLNINEELTGTATITVKGVAVEDEVGNNGKTYLDINTNNPNPSKQLKAYVADGRSVASWSSADESIATVDEKGVVTAKSVGSVIINATDSEGTTGGIKVVVQSEEIPYFENLQFLSTAIKDYSTVYAFAPTTTDYYLDIKTYSTSKLTLQNTTLFDDEKYNAVAEYTDINGEKQAVSINSGAITYLDGIPFDESKVTITLSDKSNADNKTTYNFTVTRPRDTTKTIKSNGIVLVPEERSLLKTKYNGYAEGTMFKLTDDGEFKISWGTTLATGVSGTHYSYKCFAFDDVKDFTLNITGNTVYEHLRYSLDGKEWTELPQGGGATNKLSLGNDDVTLKIQIIDDKTYTDNVASEKDGFADCEPNEYTVVISKATASSADAQMLTATTDSGDWYPSIFNKNTYTYSIVVPSDVTEKVLTYTVAEGASVKLGSTEQVANEDGIYTLSLTTSQKTLTITSADGKATNTYNFKIQKKSAGYPDKIADFLCINSQYTNGIGTGNAASPWVSLSGSSASIGNFGGYITYYYNEALIDNPNNKYGIDFYVYGNANKDTSTSTKTSFFEPAQVWVSENGESWYALAGSAHYEEGVDWNYSVTYEKTEKGKTAWTDSHGNSHDGASYSGQYPSESIYNMNELSASDKITLSGIALPARSGDIAVVGAPVDAYPVKWGYADCFVNGTKGADVNPYQDNTNFDLQTNGFDLKWAVDENGEPVDVSDKEFHYVKLVSASNIWHSSFAEKSPEIAGVVRTTAQENAVGITSAPTGITISDGAESKVVNLKDGQQIYSVDVEDMKYVSVSVNGAAETDNIYINNTRISFDGSVDGFKITKEDGAKKIRVIVQSEEKEPLVYLLKITGTASESNDLVEGVKLNVSGTTRVATTNDGKVYTASVGYRISSVAIYPVVSNDVDVTINGESIKEEYSLSDGENVFTITGKKDGITHTVTFKITKDSAPVPTGTITVYFTLLGDDEHGESEEVHTLKQGNLDTWISRTSVEVESPATVLDVFEKALEGKHTFVNADGNYISKIDSLAEFDNGALSGWMYSLNGVHSSKGVLEQSVKNGDKIVFHYTDDYTQEQGSEKWYSSNSETTANKTEATDNSATITPSAAADKNGTAKALVTESNVTTAIKAAEKNDSVTEVVIAPEIKGDASKVTTTIPENAVSKIANTEFDLTIETDIAKVTLPNENLGELNGKLSVTTEKAKNTVKVEIALDGKAINDVNGGVSVVIPEENADNSKVLAIVDENGNETIIKKSIVTDDGIKAILSGSATVKIVDNSKDFPDTDGHWGKDAIGFVSSREIFSGTDNGFEPDSNTSRAMVVTTLFRLEDAVVGGEHSFDDVPTDTWYTDAVIWANSNDIVNGTDSGFEPNGNVTREQLCAIMYRYAKHIGTNTTTDGTLEAFNDSADVSDWAVEAMNWATNNGIVTGKPGDMLDPKGYATRAEVATIYQRLIYMMAE